MFGGAGGDQSERVHATQSVFAQIELSETHIGKLAGNTRQEPFQAVTDERRRWSDTCQGRERRREVERVRQFAIRVGSSLGERTRSGTCSTSVLRS